MSPDVYKDLKEVLATRREQIGMRLGMAAAIGLAFGQITGWRVCLAWMALNVFLQLAEFRWLRGFRSVPVILTILAINSFAFGMLGAAGALYDGAWGLAGGVCMLCGGMLNASMSTQKSKPAFWASFAPYSVLFILMPMIAIAQGALVRHALIVGVAGIFISAGVVLIFRNASRAIQAEADARARAESADAAKSAFVAMVSHELRTPISAMLAGAAEAGSARSKTARAASLGLITDSARMMQALLNDLLDLSKIEAGRMTVETIDFNLRHLVEEAARFWGPEARNRGLTFEIEGARNLPAYVRGDPNRIRQVLNNLFSNALKFTDEGAVALLIDARQVAGGYWISLTVADSGAGMGRDQMERLFEPFAQADRSIARTHGGTGLGLSISRELSRLMGGDLTVASALGQGSAFELRLTLPEGEAPPSEAVDDDCLPPGLRILVADDHSINRRAFELMLAPLEAEVTLAADGHEAVELVRNQAFDLIFLDLNMPRLNGLDAARAIRKISGKALPIVALTASVSQTDIQACAEAGMNGFVGKPVRAAELYQAIHAMHSAAKTKRLDSVAA